MTQASATFTSLTFAYGETGNTLPVRLPPRNFPVNAVEDFFTFLQTSEKTRETYRINLKPFFLFLQSNGTTSPTKGTVINYVNSLVEAGKKPATVAGYLSAVKALFRYLEEAGVYADIARNVKAPKQSKKFKKKALSVGQARETLATFDRETATGKRDFAIYLLMLCNGLRTVEVSRLLVKDMEVVDGATVLAVQGKGRTEKDSYAVLSGETEKAVRDYLATRGELKADYPLFASTSNNNKGQALTTHTISAIAKKALRGAGYNDEMLTAHSLRHTAVTLGIKGGASLEQASTFARHTSIATTMIYNHTLSELENPVSRLVEGLVFNG